MRTSARPTHRRLRGARPVDRRRLNLGDPITVDEATEMIVNGATVYARIKLFPCDSGRYVDLNQDQVTDILDEEPGDQLTCFNMDLDGDLRVELHP